MCRKFAIFFNKRITIYSVSKPASSGRRNEKFDLILLRNVLIYFSMDLKRDILTRIHGVLRPGGSLFLGASESLSGVNDLFEMVHCNPGVMYRSK